MSKDFHVDVSDTTLNKGSHKFLLEILLCAHGILFVGTLIILSMTDVITMSVEWVVGAAVVTTVFAVVIAKLTRAKAATQVERRHQDLIRNDGRLFRISTDSVEVLEEALRRDNFMKPSPRGWHDLSVGPTGYRTVFKSDIESLELRHDMDENNQRLIALEWKLKNGKIFVLNVKRVIELSNIAGEFRAQGYPFKSTVPKYP